MARKASSKSAGPTANLGFEATAMRGSARHNRAAILRSLKGNLWPATDKLRIDLHDSMVAIERDNSLTTFPN